MKNIHWNTETRKVKDLIPYKSNPRQISKDDLMHLKNSLEKFDYAELIAIQPDNTIIAGHMRVKAMTQLGWKDREIQVRVASTQLDEKDMREYLIRSNKNTGAWDYDLLANEFDLEDLYEWGFSAKDLDFSLDDEEPSETEEENGQLEPPKNPITKLGDVYDLGLLGHRIVCGDSTDADVVNSCLLDNIPILMVTDPPYGVNYDPAWRIDISDKKGVGCKAIGLVKNDDKFDWSEAYKLFTGSVVYLWHSGKYCSEIQKSLEASNYEIISQLIWVKQHFCLSRGDYHWQHEPCWYAVKKGHKHNWQGARDQSSIWEIANLNAFGKNQEDERTAHSTQKPLECMARPIRNNTAKSESVYDPFLGSGTTLIAAESLGRRCFGIELDAAYCDIAVERWVNYQKKNNNTPIVYKNGEIQVINAS